MITQIASQTLRSVSKVDIAPHGGPKHNTFMQLSMKAHVLVTQLMSKTLIMHHIQRASVGTCSVSTWKSESNTAPETRDNKGLFENSKCTIYILWIVHILLEYNFYS